MDSAFCSSASFATATDVIDFISSGSEISARALLCKCGSSSADVNDDDDVGAVPSAAVAVVVLVVDTSAVTAVVMLLAAAGDNDNDAEADAAAAAAADCLACRFTDRFAFIAANLSVCRALGDGAATTALA